MKVLDLPTPALAADMGVLEKNMRCMDEILRGRQLRLRPHYKSHKCAALAHRQMAAGAAGMTCAKLSEAEDLIFSGIPDVLIANQVVDPAKILRLAQLSKLCRLTVCVDDKENAKALSEAAVFTGGTIHCLVELDIGMRRCGARTEEEYLETASYVSSLPGLVYEGIQAYAGYASHIVDTDERVKVTRENERRVAALAQKLRERGIEVMTISGGSTGTAQIKAEDGIYTELQAGSYLFMDSTYDHLDVPFGNALFVVATVVSRNDDAVILDAGVKGLGADQNPPVILDQDGIRVTGRYVLDEEHLKLYESNWKPSAGEKVRIIPGHCCSTVNLYDRIYLCRGDAVEDRIPVTARGRSQ